MSIFQFSHVSRRCSLCDDGTCAWILRLIKASPMPPTPCCWLAVWWTVACFLCRGLLKYALAPWFLDAGVQVTQGAQNLPFGVHCALYGGTPGDYRATPFSLVALQKNISGQGQAFGVREVRQSLFCRYLKSVYYPFLSACFLLAFGFILTALSPCTPPLQLDDFT